MGKTSRLWGLTGEDAMKASLAAIAGTLVFAVYLIFISPPLQQVGQQLESLVR